jgi:uncharacterized protein YraI
MISWIVLASALLSMGCSSNIQGETAATRTPIVIPSTLAASVTPAFWLSPLPPSPQPTAPGATPVDGITSTQVNVRAEPSTASNVLGVIPADMSVEITGKDPEGNWWQINYAHPEAVDGKGWVTAQYITLPSPTDVPVIGGSTGPLAVVQQQINVRSGPGTAFNSLGTLKPQDVLSLTGKNPNGAWLQIDFPTGPEGKGWINAAFVQAQGTEGLPVIAESGQILGTGTPTTLPPTITPTLIPAWQDGDTYDHPIASIIFEPTGTETVIYHGDLSVPQGDEEDWIAFKPYDRFVFAHLECHGSDSVDIKIIENTSPLDTYIKCDDQIKQVAVKPNASYLIHLQAVSSAETLEYTSYILTIKTRP